MSIKEEDISKLINLAKIGLNRIKEVLNKKFVKKEKKDGSLYSEADCKSDEAIRNQAKNIFPGVPIHSEESQLDDWENNEILLSTVIENRFDSLFKEIDKNPAKNDKEPRATHCPVSELKCLVYSLDWEINDGIIADFLMHTNNLMAYYKDDRIILMFLNILKALGKYIRNSKSNAHSDAFQILNSVFNTMDQVISAEDMPEVRKENLLQIELKKYKKLKHRISNLKVTDASRKNPGVLIFSDREREKGKKANNSLFKSEDRMSVISKTQLIDIKNDIKQFIHNEFMTLKKELKLI